MPWTARRSVSHARKTPPCFRSFGTLSHLVISLYQFIGLYVCLPIPLSIYLAFYLSSYIFVYKYMLVCIDVFRCVCVFCLLLSLLHSISLPLFFPSSALPSSPPLPLLSARSPSHSQVQQHKWLHQCMASHSVTRAPVTTRNWCWRRTAGSVRGITLCGGGGGGGG